MTLQQFKLVTLPNICWNVAGSGYIVLNAHREFHIKYVDILMMSQFAETILFHILVTGLRNGNCTYTT